MRAIALAALALAALAAGGPGSLDRSFGSGGKVLTKIGEGSAGQTVALQRDGKIVVAGAAHTGSNWDFALARYTSRGRLDQSFGRGGTVTTDFGSDYDYAFAMKIQPDGKIVVAGWTNGSGGGHVALARYRPNGSLDPTFGSDGKVVGPLGSGFALAVQRDGKVVVGGAADRSFAVFRFKPDGSLDPGFGTNGEVTTPFDLDSAAIRGLAIQSDGNIVAVGSAVGHEVTEWALARYTQEGSLDTTFGAGGTVTVFENALSNNLAEAVVFQGDRRILVAGTQLEHVALAGFLLSGALDPTFGVDAGVTTLDSYSTTRAGEASAVRLQRDGKIVTAGIWADLDIREFFVARFNHDGIPDQSFRSQGIAKTDLTAGEDSAYGLVLQRDGKLVAAGVAGNTNGSDGSFALVRYLASSACRVPDVRGRPVGVAKQMILHAHCSLGHVAHAFSSSVRKGRVISQRPWPGSSRPEHARVRLVVSSGRR
ncbi:MAG TPA: PASTA domain-containing protein [Gaiellaceae bacterium]